jgi:hypothetical protein
METREFTEKKNLGKGDWFGKAIRPFVGIFYPAGKVSLQGGR